MSTGKFYISQYRHLRYQHGGVGYTDMETILEKAGYQPLTFPETSHGGFSRLPGRVTSLLRYLRAVGPGSTVVFIHPVYARMHRILLRLLARRRVRLICVL